MTAGLLFGKTRCFFDLMDPKTIGFLLLFDLLLDFKYSYRYPQNKSLRLFPRITLHVTTGGIS